MKRALFVAMTAVLALGACKHDDKVAQGGSAPPPPAAPAQKPAAPPANDPWTATQNAAPKKDPLPHPLFWSIEKDGKTTYALGTIHVGVDPETRLPDVVFAKLDAAPAFAMETDLSDPALMQILECSNCSLKRDLGDAYYKKLEAALTPAVAAQVESKKPMVAATMLSMKGLQMTTQMDTLLLARAQRQKKQIIFLEPAMDEAKVLERWMDVKALKLMLDDAANSEQHIKDMLDAYVNGDEAKMVKMSDDEKADALKGGYTPAEYEQEMKDMLYNRNAVWVPEIEKMHAAGGGFIAVGAMHLVGPNSVLELLGKKGYKISRVSP